MARVRLLGDVAVERGGGIVRDHGARNRGVLALLALCANDPVTVDALIDEVWGDVPAKDPVNRVRIAISRVRTWLGSDDDGPPVHKVPGGYVLRIDPDDVDLSLFHRRTTSALTGSDLDACRHAESVWQGAPLPGLTGWRSNTARSYAEDRRRALLRHHAELLTSADRAEEAVTLLGPEDHAHEEIAVPYLRALVAVGRLPTARATARAIIADLDDPPGEELATLHESLIRPAATHDDGVPGREPLVREVLDLLAGRGGLVVVQGPAGVGKSTVLRGVLRAAQERGSRTAASAWGEGEAPAAAWHEVSVDLGIDGPHPRPGELGVRLHQHLVSSGGERLLVALDDAHRADSASLDVLLTLVRRGLPAGTVLVVAARSPDVVERVHWVSALAALVTEGLVPIALGPLPPTAVEALVRERLAHLLPDDGLVAAVARRAGGHALHLTALLDEVARCDTRAEAARAIDAVPTRVRAVLAHQVGRLPRATRRALETLAVLLPVDLTALADVLGERPLDVADALEPAVRAGLVTADEVRYTLRHDLDVAGLRAEVPAARAAHLHAARLSALAPDADVFVVLRHTLGAGDLVGPARRAAARIAAGREAYRTRALPEALALLDAARPDSPVDLLPTLLVVRALCLSVLGAAEDLDDVLDEAFAAAWEAGDDQLLLLAAVGDEPLGVAIDGDLRRLARLRRLAERPLPSRMRLELLTGLVREEGATGGRATQTHIDEAIALGEVVAAEDPAARARVRALQARFLVDVAHPAPDRVAVAADAHRLAFDTDVPALHLDAVELLMSAELAIGHTERAHKLRAELQALAERWHRPRAMWAALVVEAAMLQAEGDPAADEAAERAFARGVQLGLSSAPIARGAHLLMNHLLAGTVSGLAPLAAQASEAAPNTGAWSAAAALAEVRAGRPEPARMHLAEYRRRVANPSMWFMRAAHALAAGAAFGLHDAEASAAIRAAMPSDPDAAVLVGYGGAVLGPVCLWTGLAAWTTGDLAAARLDLSAATALADRAGWPPWSAAARQGLVALDDAVAPLPFGLPRSGADQQP